MVWGDYGDDWVMYKQSGTDAFEVNATHKNTNKIIMTYDEHAVPGKGYWIIVDTNGNSNAVGDEINVTIDKTLLDITPTSTVDALSVSISNPDFTKVNEYQLPKGGDVNDVKYMAGNPFPFAFHLSDLYFKHNASGEDYNPMVAQQATHTSTLLFTSTTAMKQDH